MLKDLPTYKLSRFEQGKAFTKGYIVDKNLKLCCTIEPGWNWNMKDNPATKENEASCIPEGMYLCKKYSGTEFKNVWEITGVAGKSGVLIHNGNYAIQSKSCVIVGDKHMDEKGIPIVNNSVNTLNKLRTILPDNFWLKIECEGFSNSLCDIDKAKEQDIKELRV